MNFRQKLIYTALGGGLMLVGMLLTTITPLTAQKDVFGDITCSSLTVVDTDGIERIRLSVDEHGADVSIVDKDQGAGVHLKANDGSLGGASVDLWGKHFGNFDWNGDVGWVHLGASDKGVVEISSRNHAVPSSCRIDLTARESEATMYILPEYGAANFVLKVNSWSSYMFPFDLKKYWTPLTK